LKRPDLPRKSSTIPRAARTPTKQQPHLNKKPSRFAAWRLFVFAACNAYHSWKLRLPMPLSGKGVSQKHQAIKKYEREVQELTSGKRTPQQFLATQTTKRDWYRSCEIIGWFSGLLAVVGLVALIMAVLNAPETHTAPMNPVNLVGYCAQVPPPERIVRLTTRPPGKSIVEFS
jgi:hypothetical protein